MEANTVLSHALTDFLQVFVACSTVDLVALMDQTTLAVAVVAIASDLQAGANAAWISNAYFLTSTSFQLLYGRVSDIGRSTRRSLRETFRC